MIYLFCFLFFRIFWFRYWGSKMVLVFDVELKWKKKKENQGKKKKEEEAINACKLCNRLGSSLQSPLVGRLNSGEEEEEE